MSTIHDVLRELLLLPGATYSCAAVRASGELVAEAGGEPVDPAVVLRWARTAADFLADADDDLDDLMVTSRRSYRLVRPIQGGGHEPLLLHLCLDRSRANLAAARHELTRVRLDRPGEEPGESPPGGSRPVGPSSSGYARSPGLSPVAPAASGPAASGPAGSVPLPRRVPSAIPPPPTREPRPRTRRPALATSRASAPAVPPGRTPAGPAGVARPRESVPLPVPRAEDPGTATAPTAAPTVAAPRWADDVTTMRRILAGLRGLR